MTALSERIADLIAPSLHTLGCDLLRVQIDGRGHARVQIMAERHDRRGLTIEDCARISRTVSAVLDVEDPFEGSYTLEVSSPGIDRPLLRPEDYDRFAGHTAKIELRGAIDGRRRFTGVLAGREGTKVLLDLAEGDQRVALQFDDIERAKLVLTDKLLAGAPAPAADNPETEESP